MDKGHMYGFN